MKKHMLSLLAVFLLLGSYSNEAVANECNAGYAGNHQECLDAMQTTCLNNYSCNYASCGYPTNEVIRMDCDQLWDSNDRINKEIQFHLLYWSLGNLFSGLDELINPRSMTPIPR